MALLDIHSYSGAAVLEFNRGNTGIVADIVAKSRVLLEIPKGAAEGAVFPSDTDVDSGVVYGPNGTDFVGALVQPAAEDVKLGTQYGGDGAEFTGEYAPEAGGGNVFVICD